MSVAIALWVCRNPLAAWLSLRPRLALRLCNFDVQDSACVHDTPTASSAVKVSFHAGKTHLSLLLVAIPQSIIASPRRRGSAQDTRGRTNHGTRTHAMSARRASKRGQARVHKGDFQAECDPACRRQGVCSHIFSRGVQSHSLTPAFLTRTCTTMRMLHAACLCAWAYTSACNLPPWNLNDLISCEAKKILVSCTVRRL
jgi:hypothetical protein